MLSSTPKHLLTNTFALTALALGMKDASALDITIPNMLFNNPYAASGNINFEQGTGSFTSLDPFYGMQWTANVLEVFTSAGAHTYAGTSLQGTYNYQFTLAPGQVAAGVKFNWNNNNDIPVLTAFDCSAPDQGCVAIAPAGTTPGPPGSVDGVQMQTQPFKGSGPAFNDKAALVSQAATGNIPIGPKPIALPSDVAANGQVGQPVTWLPSINGSTARTCSIDQNPASGTATVQSDCSSGSFTGTVAGANTFTYRVTSDNGAGSDNATVTVTLAAIGGNSPPTAVPDSAKTTAATPVVIDVLANDSDSDGTLVPASVTISSPPANGIASKNATTGEITYTPNPGFCGTDTLSYTVLDNNAVVSSPAAVTVDVSSNVPCSSQAVTLSGGSSDPDNDGLVSLSELLSAGIPSDGGVSTPCIGGCFDYRLTGLTTPTATVILPLSEPIPTLSRVRKFDGNAWIDFVSSGADSVATAASDAAGDCPGTGYTSGLKVGDNCLQLVITDGGPNDQDGAANGTIVDPVGVGRSGLSSATTDLSDPFGSVRGDGCTIRAQSISQRFDAAWAVLLGFIGWLGLGRKKRKFN